MIQRLAALSAIPLATLLLSHCGSNEPGPVLVGQSKERIAEGDAIFRKGQAEEAKGDIDDAIDHYEEVAEDYPFSNHAGEARYRQAMLLDQEGDRRDAFEAYSMFLKHYPGHPKHGEALERIYEIATGAKEGEIKNRFLGLKSKIPLKETVEMLSTVKLHAPESDMAAKAQYAIGDAYLREKRYPQAVEAFRKVADEHREHPLAPEALFKVGEILLESAKRGNQNQATIDLSREAFNDYLIQFPGHKYNAEARKMIATLKKRDLNRSMEIADFYYKTGKFEAAKIYYRDIVDNSTSGKLHDKAKARLKELEN
ncbi:MAG: outer membrane protein assembly factor BamD [Akkermansiaceae bacterium]|nr:outer membrane protein assembly factor BamD [Akkermansiaceae bacterium]